MVSHSFPTSTRLTEEELEIPVRPEMMEFAAAVSVVSDTKITEGVLVAPATEVLCPMALTVKRAAQTVKGSGINNRVQRIRCSVTDHANRRRLCLYRKRFCFVGHTCTESLTNGERGQLPKNHEIQTSVSMLSNCISVKINELAIKVIMPKILRCRKAPFSWRDTGPANPGCFGQNSAQIGTRFQCIAGICLLPVSTGSTEAEDNESTRP